VEPTTPGSFPMFIVSDLTKDERFNQLPFVTGKPFLKFYAGTPLITKRGIPIGSLFVVDDRMRTGLSIEETHFMGTMACTIMRHLEMVREVEERRRGMKMSRGLASFVEGRSQLVEEDLEADNEGVSVAGQFAEEDIVPTPKSKSRASNRPSRTPSKASSVSSIEQKEREYSEALSKKEEAIMVSGRDVMTTGTETSRSSDRPTTLLDSQPQSYDEISMSVPSPTTESSRKLAAPLSPGESEASVMKALFSRAANLIREAFEVDGGSVFFDAQKGFTTEYTEEEEEEVKAESPISPEDPMGRYEDIRANNAAVKDDPNKFPRPARQTTFSANFASRNQMFSRPGISDRTVEILGFSTPQASSLHGDPDPSPQVFSRFGQKSLHALLRRYPRGKLWTFDEDGAVSSSEEDGKPLRRPTTGANQQRQKKKDSRPTQEAKILLRHFPGVRQLLFVPLWDSARSRWLSANFTWSNELTRILTKQSELNFLTAFGNSVMAECSRIDTEIADQKKGDFIGSISHELRSPLHGILASAEFLGEEVTEGFSKGLVETIDSCGRTLLDTINHILDFSKINHFEKNWRRSRRGVSGSSRLGPPTASSLALRQADLPMINLFTELDISIVCEEVVEGIFAGHVFQNVTAPSFDMVPDSRGRMSDPKKYVASSDPMMEDLNVHSAETAVILDIDIQDYHFTTQPGAFRRIIMNTVGNALKYTSHGYVRIQLEAVEMDDFVAGGGSETIPRSCVTLTVTDTGKGISSEFLRSHLFTPFAQENSLSSGTGLGLSIVRSIVALLEGEIQIKSEVGRGTGMF
jgi:signal transduction histidine kinase